jgi:hypothetical protein
MRTEDLLEQCLQALTSGEELPPDLTRYLARHPDQRAEVEELLAVAQRASRLPPAELAPAARDRMQTRLAERLGFDPAALDATPTNVTNGESLPGTEQPQAEQPHARKPILSLGRVSLARLRYEPPPFSPDDESEARIRAVFRDLTPQDIRRYIGVRGEDYLYYRQRFPGWKPVLSVIAVVLRGLKRIEMLASTYN